MTRLPAVLAVISSPSRIETPEETRVPRVRVNRDTADFRRRSPRNGALRRAPRTEEPAPADEGPPESEQELRGPHYDPRGERQLHVHRGEHGSEGRNDP